MDATGGRTRRVASLAVIGLALAALIAGALWWSARTPAPTPFLLHEQVPAKATQVVWIDRLGDVVDGLDDLGRRIRGAEGLSEAAALLAGLPRLDRQTLLDAGLDPDAGLVAWQSGGAVWLSTRVAHAGGAEHVVDVLQRRGHSVQPGAAAQDGARLWTIAARGQPDELPGMLRLRDDVLLLRWRLPAAVRSKATKDAKGANNAAGDLADDAGAALLTYDDLPRKVAAALTAADGVLHARLALTPEVGFHKAARKAIGPGVLLFGRLVDGLQRAELDLRLGPALPRLSLRLLSAPAATKAVADYHQGFLAEGTPLLDLGALLPDEVAAMARLRLNPALLGMVPKILLSRVLPSSSLSWVHPSLAALDAHTLLLDQLDGQVAVGLLGVDDAAPADPRTWAGRGLRRTVGAFVAASMRSDQAARGLLERMQTVLREGGHGTSPQKLGEFAGFTLTHKQAPWTLLRRGRALVWISGPGELQRFERVARGRFPSLASSSGSDVEREVASGGAHWIGLLLTTGRISRSMRRRGIPAHFVRMVGSVAALATVLRVQPDGLALELTVRPRRKAEPGK